MTSEVNRQNISDSQSASATDPTACRQDQCTEDDP